MTPEAQAIIVLDDVQLIGLDHRDSQFIRAELTEKIAQAIAAAVAAEREACAVIADNASSHIVKNAINTQRNQIEWARDRVSEGIAAAIRARGEGGKE